MKKFKFGRISLEPLLEYFENGSVCVTFLENSGEEYITLNRNFNSPLQSKTRIFVSTSGTEHELAEALVAQKYMVLIESPVIASGYNKYQLYEIKE